MRPWQKFFLWLLLVAVAQACAAVLPAQASEPAPKVWIGAHIRQVEFPPSPLSNGLSGGVRIEVVEPGPAMSAGIRQGDVILSANGKPTPDVTSLFGAYTGLEPGRSVPFVLLRGRDRLTVDVTFAARPADGDKLSARALAACIADGEALVANTMKSGDYPAAFEHNVWTARCANSADDGKEYLKDLVAFVEIVPKLRSPPKIPSEAERHNLRAVAMLKDAETAADFDKATGEFGAAIYEAPWVPDLYLNRALASEKAGSPEWAISDFKRYQLLNPAGSQTPQVMKKMTELEVLAQERKPWLPFLGTVSFQGGAAVSLELRGRKLVVRVANNLGKNEKAQIGDVIYTGTIHGTEFEGKVFVRPNAPNVLSSATEPESSARCFGLEQQNDAQAAIEPDGAHLAFKAKSAVYDRQTCVASSAQWMAAARFSARAGSR